MIDTEFTDLVNHPPHYRNGTMETIDVIEGKLRGTTIDAFEGYLIGNIIKYLTRYPYKGGVQDIEKALWYLEKLRSVNKNKEEF